MGLSRRYIGIDESGSNPMYFVAAFSFDSRDVLFSSERMAKRRGNNPDRKPSHDFIYTTLNQDNTSINSRIRAIYSLLVHCGLQYSDRVIIDAFGEENQVKEKLMKGLSAYGISANGNILIEHDADRRYAIVNEADSIANLLHRRNGSSGFGSKEMPILPDAQHYIDQVYKTAR
mgnify:CR=1 FL=1